MTKFSILLSNFLTKFAILFSDCLTKFAINFCHCLTNVAIFTRPTVGICFFLVIVRKIRYFLLRSFDEILDYFCSLTKITIFSAIVWRDSQIFLQLFEKILNYFLKLFDKSCFFCLSDWQIFMRPSDEIPEFIRQC